MVVYFMTKMDSIQEYLGTIQCFFLINCFYTTTLRIINGILLSEHVIFILIGMTGILIGGQISKKLISHLNADIVRKLTYLMIGISGIMNLLR